MSLLTATLTVENAEKHALLHNRESDMLYVVTNVEEIDGDDVDGFDAGGRILEALMLNPGPKPIRSEIWLRGDQKTPYLVEGHVEDLKLALRSVTATVTAMRTTGGIVSFYEVHDGLPVTMTLGRSSALTRLHEWGLVEPEEAQLQVRSSSPYAYHRVRTTCWRYGAPDHATEPRIPAAQGNPGLVPFRA